MKTAAQSVIWYSDLLKTLLGFISFFSLGILYCSDQTLDSHFEVILHDFHTEEVLSIRFQETSQTVHLAIFSSINIWTRAPKYSTITYYFSVFSFPHRKFKAFYVFIFVTYLDQIPLEYVEENNEQQYFLVYLVMSIQVHLPILWCI